MPAKSGCLPVSFCPPPPPRCHRGKGSKGRAAKGDRPIGAAAADENHTQRRLAKPPPVLRKIMVQRETGHGGLVAWMALAVHHSGLFIDYREGSVHGLSHCRSLQRGYSFWNATGLHPDCVSGEAEPWRCIFPGYLTKYIQTPVFAIQDKYDNWAVKNVLGLPVLPCLPRCLPAALRGTPCSFLSCTRDAVVADGILGMSRYY